MNTFRMLKVGTWVCGAALVASTAAAADDGASVYAGRANVYTQLHENSLEDTTTPERIRAVTRGNVAPMAIWKALEHGERVECLSCIPGVAGLLYDPHDRTREISAWWLRRRIFGVFGAGEVYSQVVDTLNADENEMKRAYAADALGEFLVHAGVRHVSTAAVTDTSAIVREHAVRAMRRLNTEGPNGELASAMSDSAPEVRLAALDVSTGVNVFTGTDAVVERISDDRSDIRRQAAEVLGTLRAGDAVMGLVALTNPENEADPEVRKAAVASLGQIGDVTARDAVEAATADPDFLVQSAARIALRQL